MVVLQHIRDFVDLDVEKAISIIYRSRVYAHTILGMRIRLQRRMDGWEGKTIIMKQIFVNEAGEPMMSLH